jgi:hypothetical protein
MAYPRIQILWGGEEKNEQSGVLTCPIPKNQLLPNPNFPSLPSKKTDEFLLSRISPS